MGKPRPIQPSTNTNNNEKMVRYSSSLPDMRSSVVSTRTSQSPSEMSSNDSFTIMDNPNNNHHLPTLLSKELSKRALQQPSSSSSSHPSPPSPVVMFADRVSIYQIESYEEVEKRWYTSGEYFFIKKDALNTVRRMSNTTIRESDSSTTRGLEIVESEAIRKRKSLIASAVKVVLDIEKQHHQQKGDRYGGGNSSLSSSPSASGSKKVVVDPAETIAEACRMITHDSVEKSIRIAARDAHEAARILKDIRHELGYNSTNHHHHGTTNSSSSSGVLKMKSVTNVVRSWLSTTRRTVKR